uniref:BclA C-terminal domain-containing protein n=1 Tax=Bacillus cereus TaxID=1396 RepID=UPI00356AB843
MSLIQIIWIQQLDSPKKLGEFLFKRSIGNTINGNPLAGMINAPLVGVSSLNATIITNLPAGAAVSLHLSGLLGVTLSTTTPGATLTIIRLS